MQTQSSPASQTVPIESAGERLDKLLTALLSHADASVSRSRVQQLIKDGSVTVNGKAERASYKVDAGDELSYPIPEQPKAREVLAEDIPLDVVYEDEAVAAINKPAGMVVHPALGHWDGTLVNAVLHRWPQTAEVGERSRAGIVHRLDMDTSGVILIAKTDDARRNLLRQFKARHVQKRYVALVHGMPATPTGEINAPIGRDPRQRNKKAVVRDGRESLSTYNVLTDYGDMTFVEVLPHTGRTHQIRVHLAFIKTPVVGDTVYGHRKERGPVHIPRQFLHAESLTFVSPATKQPVTVHAPLPSDLQRVLDSLERLKKENEPQ